MRVYWESAAFEDRSDFDNRAATKLGRKEIFV